MLKNLAEFSILYSVAKVVACYLLNKRVATLYKSNRQPNIPHL